MSLETLHFFDLNGPKITAHDLAQFERDYGVHVPAELKTLFLRMNDCLLENPIEDSTLEYSIVACAGIEGGVMPERWVGIASNGMNHLLDLFGTSLGEHVLPFCRDPGGSIFMVAMDGERQVGVYFVATDEPYMDGDVKRYQTYWLADNLTDFAAKITFI
jgi:hypothetical protein